MLAASSASVPEPPPSRASGEVELVQLPAADGGLPVAVDTSAVFPEQAAPAAVTPWQPAVGMQALEVHSRSSQFHHPAAVKEITTIKPRNKLGENKNQTQKKKHTFNQVLISGGHLLGSGFPTIRPTANLKTANFCSAV